MKGHVSICSFKNHVLRVVSKKPLPKASHRGFFYAMFLLGFTFRSGSCFGGRPGPASIVWFCLSHCSSTTRGKGRRGCVWALCKRRAATVLRSLFPFRVCVQAAGRRVWSPILHPWVPRPSLCPLPGTSRGTERPLAAPELFHKPLRWAAGAGLGFFSHLGPLPPPSCV